MSDNVLKNISDLVDKKKINEALEARERISS